MQRSTFRSEDDSRVQFEESVALIGQDRLHVEGLALNLSRGGMFVRSESATRLPRALRVLFQLPGAGPIDAQAKIVRIANPNQAFEPQGIALRFESMSSDCAQRLQAFIEGRLQPASGERLRLEIGDLGAAVGATAHSCWDDLLSVEAELPFLRVGMPVRVRSSHGERTRGGTVRWVTIHPDATSGIPRLNIGIEMARPKPAVEQVIHDEQHDPVLTRAFVEHARVRERAVVPSRAAPEVK